MIDLLVMGYVVCNYGKVYVDVVEECLDFDDFGNIVGGFDEIVKGVSLGFVECYV